MRVAIALGAETFSKEVGGLINKIELCKFFNWTPRQYGNQKWTDLRKFKNYFRWKVKMKDSVK